VTVVHLHERLEYAGEPVGRNTDAGVANDQPHALCGGAVPDPHILLNSPPLPRVLPNRLIVG